MGRKVARGANTASSTGQTTADSNQRISFQHRDTNAPFLRLVAIWTHFSIESRRQRSQTVSVLTEGNSTNRMLVPKLLCSGVTNTWEKSMQLKHISRECLKNGYQNAMAVSGACQGFGSTDNGFQPRNGLLFGADSRQQCLPHGHCDVDWISVLGQPRRGSLGATTQIGAPQRATTK